MILKTIQLLTLSIIIALKVLAQQPEPVYTFVKQKETVEWNKAQALAWKNELEKNPGNAIGWKYYYQANHNIHSLAGGQGALAPGMTDSLHGIVEKMGVAIPNSFEYNCAMYYYGSQITTKDEYYPYLLKAYAIDSSRWETYEDLATVAEMKNDKATKRKFMEKWYNANQMSPGFLNWNYNVLMSLDKNAVLFTAGDDDTYPAWMLQDVKGVRTDVRIINLSLFTLDSYRKIICRELGIPYFEMKNENNGNEMDEMGKWIVSHITNRPVYFIEGADPAYYKSFEDSMYLEGLAMRYSPNKYDNMGVLKNNIESRFLLDYLKTGFTNDISEGVVDYLNTNYIAPFIKLYQYYNDKGEKQEAKHYKDMAMTIGEKANMKDEVDNYLSKTKKQ